MARQGRPCNTNRGEVRRRRVVTSLIRQRRDRPLIIFAPHKRGAEVLAARCESCESPDRLHFSELNGVSFGLTPQ
jgi:hypothetical protein